MSSQYHERIREKMMSNWKMLGSYCPNCEHCLVQEPKTKRIFCCNCNAFLISPKEAEKMNLSYEKPSSTSFEDTNNPLKMATPNINSKTPQNKDHVNNASIKAATVDDSWFDSDEDESDGECAAKLYEVAVKAYTNALSSLASTDNSIDFDSTRIAAAHTEEKKKQHLETTDDIDYNSFYPSDSLTPNDLDTSTNDDLSASISKHLMQGAMLLSETCSICLDKGTCVTLIKYKRDPHALCCICNTTFKRGEDGQYLPPSTITPSGVDTTQNNNSKVDTERNASQMDLDMDLDMEDLSTLQPSSVDMGVFLLSGWSMMAESCCFNQCAYPMLLNKTKTEMRCAACSCVASVSISDSGDISVFDLIEGQSEVFGSQLDPTAHSTSSDKPAVTKEATEKKTEVKADHHSHINTLSTDSHTYSQNILSAITDSMSSVKRMQTLQDEYDEEDDLYDDHDEFDDLPLHLRPSLEDLISPEGHAHLIKTKTAASLIASAIERGCSMSELHCEECLMPLIAEKKKGTTSLICLYCNHLEKSSQPKSQCVLESETVSSTNESVSPTSKLSPEPVSSYVSFSSLVPTSTHKKDNIFEINVNNSPSMADALQTLLDSLTNSATALASAVNTNNTLIQSCDPSSLQHHNLLCNTINDTMKTMKEVLETRNQFI